MLKKGRFSREIDPYCSKESRAQFAISIIHRLLWSFSFSQTPI